MSKQIIFTQKNKAEFLDVEDAVLKPNQVKVKTVVSTISSGTERANITGNPTVSLESKPGDTVVFPRHSGYSASGIVVEKGEDVKTLEIGDRVAMYWSFHKTYNIVNEENAVKIENDNVSFEEAAIAHIGTFPLAAIRKTKLEIGESLMVMGLGTLGLLAVHFARAAGAVPVIAVDPVKERREKALKFGADYALDPFDEGFTQKVKEITGGGVNVAIEVTGQGAGLNETLDCMARMGRVALLGCTRESDFNVDYYRKVHGPGITLIGAHTLARPQNDSYPGYFTTADDIKAILKLCANNRINLKDMIDETHSPYECEEIYNRLINDKNFPTIVQYNWEEFK
ncbi:MAG: zinc-binding alcohol dehydrogenase [Clostridia bacterium]|nr:zinc-binding alcohol dehydrogenase [Clostridia bacterium]